MEAVFRSNYEEIGQNIIEIFMHRPVYHMILTDIAILYENCSLRLKILLISHQLIIKYFAECQENLFIPHLHPTRRRVSNKSTH